MLVYCSRSTYTKIGTIQRRLAWPLRKDDTQIREAFHIFGFEFDQLPKFKHLLTLWEHTKEKTTD